MIISTGEAEQHPTPLPLDSTHTPDVQAQTARVPSGAQQGGVSDTLGQQAERLDGYERDLAAAMAAGMAAELGRRGGYHADILPAGAAYGDTMMLSDSPLDPGVGSTGTTDPSGALYDPPRNYG
jgi:hypothetical protein